MKSSQDLFTSLLIAAVVISFFLILSNVGVFPHKTPGSFEYVRKAEALMEKGNNPEAIKYFEKAYESSPESEIIKKNLVYAYSVYGKLLAQDNKYDEAIDCLTKAYNVTPNASAAQNLAMIYSAKALHEAGKGDISAAKSTYEKARNIASASESASRNLSIVLYNDGVNEFKSGHEETAILCLKESAYACKEAQTFKFLGDVYYKRAQLHEARYYWNRAKELNPASVELAGKLAKINKEIELTARERESKLEHFEIRYKDILPIDKELASEILEQAYADVGKDLNYFPKERTKVFFYSKKDFKSIFKMPYVVNAFYDGSIKMPAPETLLEREKFSQYIYHEYTHALISAKTNNNCPIWLSEGIALWEEYRQDRRTIEDFFVKIKNLPDISIRFLENNFKTAEINKDRALCYMISYTLVSYILDNWGVAGLQGILDKLAKKQHIINAIDDQLLLSQKEFERKWRDYALSKYFINI